MSSPPVRGTTPPGVTSEREAAEWVRSMFDRVANRYDLLNHLLSFNLDRLWRARTVRALRPWLGDPGPRIVDLCCGTGDLLIALENGAGTGVTGSDFSRPMLETARRKLGERCLRSALVEADALALPFASGALDVVTVAFGFRNLANYHKGLVEMRRVLKPGGAAAILEFSQPGNAFFGALYGFYSRHVLPRVGGAISGEHHAYAYLPESVRKFPSPEALAVEMQQCGFADVRFERMTGGIVALHLGVAAQPDPTLIR